MDDGWVDIRFQPNSYHHQKILNSTDESFGLRIIYKYETFKIKNKLKK